MKGIKQERETKKGRHDQRIDKTNQLWYDHIRKERAKKKPTKKQT